MRLERSTVEEISYFLFALGNQFISVKNAEGADSPATSRRDQTLRAAKWLAAAGVEIPKQGDEIDAVIEISPLFAVSAEQLKSRKLPKAVAKGEQLYLG